MFEFFKNESDELRNQLLKTSHGRYLHRQRNFRVRYKRVPDLRHYGWWVLHNTIIHPLLGLFPCKAMFKAHDWSSDRLNLKGEP